MTRSHFDHEGAACYLKSIYPAMKIVGSARTSEIMANPRAVQLIRQLKREASNFLDMEVNAAFGPQDFEPFRIDVVPEPQQSVEPDGVTWKP